MASCGGGARPVGPTKSAFRVRLDLVLPYLIFALFRWARTVSAGDVHSKVVQVNSAVAAKELVKAPVVVQEKDGCSASALVKGKPTIRSKRVDRTHWIWRETSARADILSHPYYIYTDVAQNLIFAVLWHNHHQGADLIFGAIIKYAYKQKLHRQRRCLSEYRAWDALLGHCWRCNASKDN